jgi:hypothetical protein
MKKIVIPFFALAICLAISTLSNYLKDVQIKAWKNAAQGLVVYDSPNRQVISPGDLEIAIRQFKERRNPMPGGF